MCSSDLKQVCARGHSFDIARSGYLNLLQPQDRKSRTPGDSREALQARRRLHDRGVTAPLLEAIAELVNLTGATALDAGCGDGFYLGTLARRFGWVAHGIDISSQAVDMAAKRYPEYTWIAANADRALPYSDGSFSLVLSITGRHNPAEFRRVLRPDGHLLVAIPSELDLVELRGQGRSRVDRAVREFSTHFTVVRQSQATTTMELDAQGVADTRLSMYCPGESQTAMSLTFSLDLLLLRPTG